MSSALETASSTKSLHTSYQNSADHSFHSSDGGVIAGRAGATKSPSVNSATRTQMVPMPPNATSSFSKAGGTPSAGSFHASDQNRHSFWDNFILVVTSNFAMAVTESHYCNATNSRRPSSTFHTSNQSSTGQSHQRIKDTSRRTDTYNVVIFGRTGAGKSSLVNLIARTQAAPTSSDASGCTIKTTVHKHDVDIQNGTLKVQLFDTAGLDEDSKGTVPDKQAQMDLKTLLSTLMKKGGVHLLVYCVQGTEDAWALQRNYNLTYSKVKGRVPIVLVVTGLEDQEPEMEEWWKKNEGSISDLGMDFAGHACITTLTINEDDTDEVRQRHEQSYRAVCNLIGQFCLQNETGVHRVPTIPPVRKKHKNIVLFGEAGAGKSSVVNLMAGKEVALTSLGTQRCTLHWQDYVIDFDGESYRVFDTIGIEESGLEMKEYLTAVTNAYKFIKTLDADGGVDLLLFCVRAGRFTAALQSNYRFSKGSRGWRIGGSEKIMSSLDTKSALLTMRV